MSGARRWLLVASILVAVVAERTLWSSFAFPSLATLWVAIDLAFARGRHRETRRLVLIGAGTIGLLLYAGMARIIPIDLYLLGFSPLTAIVLAAAGVLAARWQPRIALLIAVVLVAFDLSLLRSRNLFDYLVDPLIVITSLIYVSALAIGRLPRLLRGRLTPASEG